MFKKILALVLGIIPVGVFAEQPIGTPDYLTGSGIPGVAPSAVVTGGDCYITAGVLSCSGINTDFVNPGNIAPGKPVIYTDLSYAGFAGTPANSNLDAFAPITSVNIGSLKNENLLVLAPGSAPNITAADGTISVGGYIYNGTLDGATFDDSNAVGLSRLVIEGGTVSINGTDGNGVAILNIGESAIAGNQIIVDIVGPAYAHSTVTASDSLSVQSNVGAITINGDIWNNTVDGTTGRVAGTNANNVRFGAVSTTDLDVNGNVVNFGAWSNFAAGTNLDISGNIISGHGTVALDTANGLVSVGDILLSGDATNISVTQIGVGGISTGAINIASGYGTFISDESIAVNGDIDVSGNGGPSLGTLFWAKNGAFQSNNITNTAAAGDFNIISTDGIIAYDISNSGGLMALNAGSGVANGLIADSVSSNLGGTIVLDYVSGLILNNTVTALNAAGSLFVGDTTAVNGALGDMYFTTNSGIFNAITNWNENFISSKGDVSVVGDVIVNSGYALYTVPPAANFIDVLVGDVSNNGGFIVGDAASMVPSSGYGVTSFVAGNVTSIGTSITDKAATNIYVADSGAGNNNIITSAVENRSYSDMLLHADDDIILDSFTNMEQASGNAIILATNGDISVIGGANSGFLENMAIGTSEMIVRADNGAIITNHDIENSGTFMQLLAKDGIVVGGTMKNDLAGGSGTLLVGTDGIFDTNGHLTHAFAVQDLTINGGDALNASLVNTGIFKAVVTGQTYLEYGIDMTMVPNDGIFYLDTGTFVMANDSGTNGIDNFMKNRINNFTLMVQNGDFDVADIINGAKQLPTWTGTSWDYSNPAIMENPDANMYISADNIKGTSLANIGTNLTLISDAADAISPAKHGHIWITSDIFNGTADGLHAISNSVTAKTVLQANGGVVAVDGVVNNFAEIIINGETGVILNGIINAGKTFVLSKTDTGIINVNGNIINKGTAVTGLSYWATGDAYELFINAKEINLNGTLQSDSGIILVKASDGGAVNVDMTDIVINGGQVDIDALMGVALTGGVTVNGGLLNLSQNTSNLTSVGNIAIAGTLNAQDAYDITNGNVNLLANNFIMESTSGNIQVDGNVLVKGIAHSLTLNGNNVTVTSDVITEDNSVLFLGKAGDFIADVTVLEKMWAKTGTRMHLYADNVTVGTLQNDGRIDAHSMGIISNAVTPGNGINLTNGLFFDDVNRTLQTTGFIVSNVGKEFTLATTGDGSDINIATGISVNDNNILHIESADRLLIAGSVINDNAILNMTAFGDALFTGNITSGYETHITSNGVTGANITNSGIFTITSTAAPIVFANITNNTPAALMDLGNVLYPDVAITTTNFTQNDGVANVYGNIWTVANNLVVNGNGQVNLYTIPSAEIGFSLINLAANTITLTGDLLQDSASGPMTGSLNVLTDNSVITANTLNVNGNFVANSQTATYTVANNVTLNESLITENGANVAISSNSGNININGVNVAPGTATVLNDGILTLVNNSANGLVKITNGMTNSATGDMTVDGNNVDLGLVNNSGTLLIDSGTVNMLKVAGLNALDGVTTLVGKGVQSSGAFDIAGRLTQNASISTGGDVNINSANYVIDLTNGGLAANGITIANGILQESGTMTIKTSSLLIGNGGIAASDNSVIISGGNNCFGSGCTPPAGIGGGDWFPWLDANITGDITGGVQITGLGNMLLDGDYNFGDNSILQVNVLPDGFDASYDHFGVIGLAPGVNYGQIDMGTGTPIIDITGKFSSNLSGTPDLPNVPGGVQIADGQIGVSLFNSVDSGTVVWLAHADDGVEWSGEHLRDVTVAFCNADGTKCFNYLDAIRDANGLVTTKTPLAGSVDTDDLPAYLTLRNGENGGLNPDNMFLVFNPEFGGPINVYRIQPIVATEPTHTVSEYQSAGALDDLIDGGLIDAKFSLKSPIESIPIAFAGTNFETIGNEIFKRMEMYKIDFDPAALSRFSRLFAPREAEMIASDINLLDHTNARSFKSRITDEFFWNRNRNLYKLWADIEYGIFDQDLNDDITADGNKLTLNLGIDWQASKHTVVGFAGRINRLTSTANDTMDLSYNGSTVPVAGNVDLDVNDTNIGIGAYFLSTFSQKTRLYGNLFLDMHTIDIVRDQNFIGPIEGTGNAYSVTSEWGFLHDISNQYLVGNLSLRAGYNTGFDITENADGSAYMNLQSDGYFILTPGYSFILNKAFYLSPWFKIRPYLEVGAEYDIAGLDDNIQYKFASAKKYTDYTIKIDPLWVSGKIGAEFIVVSGFQFGVDYEYKFNQDIRLHNFRLSGSYRF